MTGRSQERIDALLQRISVGTSDHTLVSRAQTSAGFITVITAASGMRPIVYNLHWTVRNTAASAKVAFLADSAATALSHFRISCPAGGTVYGFCPMTELSAHPWLLAPGASLLISTESGFTGEANCTVVFRHVPVFNG